MNSRQHAVWTAVYPGMIRRRKVFATALEAQERLKICRAELRALKRWESTLWLTDEKSAADHRQHYQEHRVSIYAELTAMGFDPESVDRDISLTASSPPAKTALTSP